MPRFNKGAAVDSIAENYCDILKLDHGRQHGNCPLLPLVRDLPVGIIIADVQGIFTHINREAERILGLGDESVQSSGWSAKYGCYRPDRVTLFPQQELPLARALQGEEVRAELIFIRNAAQPQGVWIRASAAPLRSIPEQAGSAVVVFNDVSEQRRAVERIELLSRAVEQTADSVVITDHAGVIQYVNPAFEATTGYSAADALGNTPRILRSGEHTPEFYGDLWAQILRGEPFRGTLVNRKKTGELYWAEQTITPIKDDAGKVRQFVSVLKDITDWRKREEQDIQLRLARQVQQRFYRPLPPFPGLDVGTAVCPAVETGGDYVDLLHKADDSLTIALGDVSGHGLDAAMLMTLTRAYVRSFCMQLPRLSEVLTAVNRMLVSDLDEDRYVTLLLAHLNLAECTLSYASAGHVPGLLLDDTGEVRFVLESSGVPLGLFEEYEVATRTIPFQPGSLLVLLTDGVTEACNRDGDQWGLKRVIDYVRLHRAEAAQQIADGICDCSRRFAGRENQQDDVTAIVFKKTE